jgi:hypothetical protein
LYSSPSQSRVEQRARDLTRLKERGGLLWARFIVKTRVKYLGKGNSYCIVEIEVFPWCMFSITVTKHLRKTIAKDKGFTLAHSFKGFQPTVGCFITLGLRWAKYHDGGVWQRKLLTSWLPVSKEREKERERERSCGGAGNKIEPPRVCPFLLDPIS